MKTSNNILSIIGFLLISAIPYGVIAGSFLFFVVGIGGFVLMMHSMLKDIK
jgi:hypothetical protein